jgi:hypothetical protein
MTTRRHRVRTVGPLPLLLAALALLAALPPCPVSAETVLLATRETVGGSPCAPPLPLEEGLFAALFAAGHIAFGLDGAAGSWPTADLLPVARQGGAGWVLEADADFLENRIGEGPAGLSARARWTLLRAGDGTSAGTGTLEAGNEGRERTVDLAGLAAELGALIVGSVQPILAPAR